MQLGSGIKVGEALLVSFAGDNTFPVLQIYICDVQPDELAYTDAGRGKDVDNRKVAMPAACVSQRLGLRRSRHPLSSLES